MPACWSCGRSLSYPPFAMVPREEGCPGCGRSLHSCRNCRHYDPALSNQCREPNAEWVTDRERANFCELFQLSAAPSGKPDGDRSREARRKLDDLFK
jgi:hypothetical protein